MRKRRSHDGFAGWGGRRPRGSPVKEREGFQVTRRGGHWLHPHGEPGVLMPTLTPGSRCWKGDTGGQVLSLTCLALLILLIKAERCLVLIETDCLVPSMCFEKFPSLPLIGPESRPLPYSSMLWHVLECSIAFPWTRLFPSTDF